jgi:hypothetical protein
MSIRTSILSAVAAGALLAALGCAHHDPPLPPPQNDEEREAAEEEHKQRDYYEEYHTTARSDCPRRCTMANAVCSRARRICSIAEATPKDEALGVYCSVATDRCQKADHRLRYECRCWSTGPRVD